MIRATSFSKEGADAFRALVERAVDPLAYLLSRAGARFDLDSIEGSRRAAEWVLGILSRVPVNHRPDLEFKKAKVLDTLSHRLRVPLETLNSMLRQIAASGGHASYRSTDGTMPARSVRLRITVAGQAPRTSRP